MWKTQDQQWFGIIVSESPRDSIFEIRDSNVERFDDLLTKIVVVAKKDFSGFLCIAPQRLNVEEIKCSTTDVTESCFIKINDIELPRTSFFKYLGSAFALTAN
ncbi:unnamed protein product [Heligmosomoides polygyrus]|uniref:Crinkler (CRN) family protein n=1 Tax=Heligmosomoides polygyrus TaxID=6339 RepID=A0A183F266_HELPZ|nr:unnamed protein product [Heligmosomoides polygyrus]